MQRERSLLSRTNGYQKRTPGSPANAVFPQSVDEANRYLRAKDIGIRTVLSRPSEELFVSGTPTLFAVGSDGLIKETWVGYLDDNRKNEALAKVASLLGGKA